MNEKYLGILRKLEDLRRRYHEERHEESYGAPANLSDIREIYGKKINSAKSCLIVLSHIVKGHKLGEYQYTVHDPIFYALDERYHAKLKGLMKKKHKTKEDIEKIKELKRRYENLCKQVSKINTKLIKGMIKPTSQLEGLVQQEDLDDLEPSDEELSRLERD